MTKISNNFGINNMTNYAVQFKKKPAAETKCTCPECVEDKKDVNLNQSPNAVLGKAMVQVQQAKDSMDEVYQTLLAYSSADGMLSGMNYDDAFQSAFILNSMQNR